MKKSILTKKGRLLLLMLISCFKLGFAQDTTVVKTGNAMLPVSGVVTDKENGLPLEHVSVAVKGTKIGTVTNAKGEFSLRVPTNSTALVFSYAGKTRQELPIDTKTQYAVSMVPDNNSLNDVVVVGYGTQKRAHLTGAVATVNMKAIQDLPVGNLTEALKGQIVGVNVSGGFSRPGEGASLNIRQPVFLSKDGGSKDPLFVIDDIIRSKSDFDLLDATEVESLTVLKDASAAI